MDFAKRESFRRGCEGRTFLVAYEYERPPQLFYKKQGFEAVDDFNEKILNEYARVNIKPQYLKAMDMYLPVAHSKKGLPFGVNKQEHEGLFIRFINWLLK